MRRRLLIAVGALLLTGLLAAVAWVLLPPPPGVTPENLRRLRPGMTESEVERLLGVPTTFTSCVTLGYRSWWQDNDVQITLRFNSVLINGKGSWRLARGYFVDQATGNQERCEEPPWDEPEETMLQRFRRWFGIA